MSSYEIIFKRQRKWMLYLISLFLMVAGISTYTKYQPIFYGLLLGILIGFYNVWFLQKKISRFSETIMDSDNKRQGLGMISRFAAVILGTIIAVKFDMYFNLIAYLIGFVIFYPVMIIDLIVFQRKL